MNIKLKSLINEGLKETLSVEYLKNLIKGSEFENKVYIAGGAVRDELMGKPIKDIDLVVDMPEGGLKFADWATKQMGNFKEGSNPIVFPTYGTAKFNLRKVNYKGEDLSEIDIETVAPRSEKYEPGNRKPEVQGASLKADAERRDLTANSLFKNVSTGEIVDLTGRGRDDLEKGIARTPLDPDKTFADDPLRMLRLIRFFVKYNWKIPLNTLKALKRNADQLKNISNERIQDEFDKILKTDNAGRALKLIKNSGLNKSMFPEVEITTEKMNLIQKASDPRVKIAILFHDLSKGQIEAILKRLKYPNDVVGKIANAVTLQSFFNNGESDKRIRQFRRIAGKNADVTLQLIDDLNLSVDVDKIRDRLQQMKSTPIKPPVSGQDLIKMGMKSGPEFKQILDKIQDVFEENPNVSKEELLQLVKR